MLYDYLWITLKNMYLNETLFIFGITLYRLSVVSDGDVSLTAEPPPPTYGTLKGLEHSMNPLLMRYSRETDLSIAAARTECRTNIFSLPYKRETTPEPQLEPFK